MLEKVDLTRAIPKEEYKTRLPALQASLYDLQLRTSEAGLPSVIVFEGWEAAGKGTCINVRVSTICSFARRRRACQASSSLKVGRRPAKARASTCSPAGWSRAPSACT